MYLQFNHQDSHHRRQFRQKKKKILPPTQKGHAVDLFLAAGLIGHRQTSGPGATPDLSIASNFNAKTR